jgi:(p)ppGpp synthase/HD superfamily hydrolase
MKEARPLSPQYAEALAYAAHAHAWQRRKGTHIPYISHLLAVSSLVLEYGGSEDEAIAGLLHDAVEDCGPSQEAIIRRKFGDAVVDIVMGCTDGTPDEAGEKAPWPQRKQAYIAHLDQASPSVRLVSCCDKLHNARAILRDYLEHGEKLFARFNQDAGKSGVLWYYRALADAFTRLGAAPAKELAVVVEELERVSESGMQS